MNEIEELRRRVEHLERALRVRIWNDCKAANMIDEAAYAVIKRELAKIDAGIRS